MVGRTAGSIGGVTDSEMVRRDCWKYISSLYDGKMSIDYSKYLVCNLMLHWIHHKFLKLNFLATYINLDLTLHNNHYYITLRRYYVVE